MKPEEVSKGERQLVVFSLAHENYGVDITAVREIITFQKATPVPKAPECVEGIINLRGKIIPVIDLRRQLSLQAVASSQDTRIMVVELGGRTVGCVVDAVKEVLTVTQEIIDPPPVAAVVEADYLEGIAKLSESLVILINLERAIGLNEVDSIHHLLA